MDIRRISYKAISEIMVEGGYSNLVLKNRASKLENRDANFVRQLVYGVIENYYYFDWIIKEFSNTKKIQEKVKIIIKIGIYQILNMNSVPDFAAVNETVKISKKECNIGAQKFINGILRNIIKNKDSIEIKRENYSDSEYLSIKYSYKEWIIKKWICEYGYEMTEKICESFHNKEGIDIRVNNLKSNRKTLKETLKDMDIHDSLYNEDILRVKRPFKIVEKEEYIRGCYSVQDESSSLAVTVLDPKENTTVLDMCSAPGGKLGYIGEKMKNKGRIIGRDKYFHKIELIKRNMERLGLNIIELEEYDSEKLDRSLLQKCDYVLADVPCSGLGLIGKKPEIKLLKKENEVTELLQIQYRILENGSKYLRIGGKIVYSTCTINPDENINLIRKFLENNKNFKLESFSINNIGETEGYIQLLPNVHNTDGFFISKIVRVN